MEPLNTEQFIEKAKEAHGDLYDYSAVAYVNCKTKVSIRCKVHGVIDQLPRTHLTGTGCPACGNLKKGGYHKHDLESFIEKSTSVHGGKYLYDRAKYANNLTIVEVGCPIHGYFSVRASNHMRGIGCNLCAIAANGDKLRKSTENYLSEAIKAHGGKYTYPDVAIPELRKNWK